MRRGRSDYAYQINVIPGDKLFPIISHMFDTELARNTRCMFAMAARNCDYARALAIAKAGNLRRARKAGAHDANADSFVVAQFFQRLSPECSCSILSG